MLRGEISEKVIRVQKKDVVVIDNDTDEAPYAI